MKQLKQYIKVFNHKGKLYDVYYDENGEKQTEIIKKYPFELFIQDRDGEYKEFISKVPLSKIEVDTQSKFRNKIKELKEVGIKPYGTQKPEDQYRRREYDNTEVNHKLKIGYFDIETAFNDSTLDENNNIVKGIGGFPKPDEANAPMTSVVVLIDNIYYALGLKELSKPLSVSNSKYMRCKNEKQLIETFFKIIKLGNVDVLTAWNADGFDFPFIMKRMEILGMDTSIIDHNGITNTMPLYDFQGSQKIQTGSMEIPLSYYWTDMLPLYRFLTYTPRESYSLEAIGQAELGEGKVDYQDTGGGTLEDLYNLDFDKFIEYNIQDVKLLKDIDEATGLLPLAYDLSYSYGINLNDILGTTAPWAQLFYKETYKDNIILDTLNKSDEDIQFEGGNVYCNPGYYEWIMSFDVTSMYPLLGIFTFNISPETYIQPKDLHPELQELKSKYFNDKDASFDTITRLTRMDESLEKEISKVLKKHNVSVSPSGDFFDISYQGHLPKMIENIYLGRKEAKKTMFKYSQELKKYEKGSVEWEECNKNVVKYNNKQMTLKIQMNAVFGAFGTKYFILAERAIANSITAYGRFFIRKCQYNVNTELMKKFDYPSDKKPTVQIDTDANYYYLSPIVDYLKSKGKINDDMSPMEISDYLNKNIEPIIYNIIQKKSMVSLKRLFNCIDDKFLGMDREVIANKGIMIGKKNYTLNVYDLEGDRIPNGKKKIVGLNIKKTNLPEFIRKKMLEFLDIIFDKGEKEFQKELLKFKELFNNCNPSDISFPRGVNIITDKNIKNGIKVPNKGYRYTLDTPGLPVHVRASLIYNEYINKNNLTSQYDTIENGNKIKFVYLKQPNECFNSSVVGFPNDRKHSDFLDNIDMVKYIDYKMMFEKVVQKPLEPLIQALEWEFEERNTLDSFF